MAQQVPPKLPGRLGNPDMNLLEDPRLHPELRKQLEALKFGDNKSPTYPDSLAEFEKLLATMDVQANMFYDSIIPIDLPSDEQEPDIQPEEITIDGLDGNKIILYVFRPVGKETAPAVVHFHGGGMILLATKAKPNMRWAKSLAVQGVTAISVDFRNAFLDGKHNPYPAGLNDCVAAVKYIHAHKSDFNASKVIIQGESGGANLALATAIRANREGWIDNIAGVYAYVPYISGAYGWSKERQLKELPSLVENDTFILHNTSSTHLAKYYSPNNMEDPLAWPLNAKDDDLKGLPPHMLSMDEMDPLRDEGLAYARKLLAVGVQATGEVNLGIPHGTAMLFRKQLADAHNKLIRQIAAFAKSL